MTDYCSIPTFGKKHALHAVVETPKSATVKLRFEPKFAAFTVSRPLPLGIAYPFDWGFVPSTLAEDGDPVDALVLNDQPTFPGVVIACRAIGVVEIEQHGDSGHRERNDRLILMPLEHDRLGKIAHAHDLPAQLRLEIERFFLSTTFFTSKRARILGWKGPKTASDLVKRGVLAYRKKRAKSRA